METIKTFFSNLSAAVAKYSGILITAAIAISIYLFQARGKTIEQLTAQLALEKSRKELDKLIEQGNYDENDYKAKLAIYLDLKRKYSDGQS